MFTKLRMCRALKLLLVFVNQVNFCWPLAQQEMALRALLTELPGMINKGSFCDAFYTEQNFRKGNLNFNYE